jgi:hypothetical protein
MIIIGVLLNIVGLGISAWALFALAVHALPFFVGMTAGIHALQAGTGPLGAIVIGFLAAGFTLLVGQCALGATRSGLLRFVIGLLFTIPAAGAGYGATLSLSHLSGLPEWWHDAFAVVGAVIVGGTAWARMAMLAAPAIKPGIAFGPAQSHGRSAAAGG